MVTATKLSKRFGEKRVLEPGRRRASTPAASCSSPARTAPARRRSCACSPASTRRPRARCCCPTAASIGYLGHEPLVYRELTPLENLHLFGRLYRVPERAERIGMLLERFGLWEVRDQRVSTFSRGMRQRLGLCRVLLHEPELVVLDEPFNALDEAGSALLDATLDELAAAERA